MNDHAMNQILEEAFQNIVQDQGPHILQQLTAALDISGIFTSQTQDISNTLFSQFEQNTTIPENNIQTNATNTTNQTELPVVSDISNNRISDLRATTIIEHLYIHLMNDYVNKWYEHIHDYHSNMRLYQQNMANFNRTSSTILRMINNNERGSYTPMLGSNRNTTIQNTPLSNSFSLNFPSSIQEFMRHPGIELSAITVPYRMNGSSDQTTEYPTISQILQSVELFTYNEETMDRVQDTSCPVSLETFSIGDELCEIRHCHHVFKWNSLQNWFSRNSHCPVCRHDIRN